MRWDFGYAPVTPAARPPEDARALIVATPSPVSPAHLAGVLGAPAQVLIARAPLFWTRLDLPAPASAARVAARLADAGVATRYVASAEQPSLALGAPLDLRGAPVARADRWPARIEESVTPPATSPGTWFLRAGEGGINVDRARSGGGAGTRLAVIDDDALEGDALDLDAEVLVGLDAAPRHGAHGALMVAWASGARRFAGVAPDASRRLYLVPKPGRGVWALPLAIARAALDGADVILCATYVEGSTSPMLDDALEVCARLGRRGRGAPVVMPTGREASSPPGSLHASFSLGLGEPASDPRVFCVAPGARGDGWFLWRDRRGQWRPFANRGPAVRWLAPGDDVAYPFTKEGAPERVFHAESSGAGAIAAGALLLVVAANPALRRDEIGAVVDSALAPVAAEPPADRAPIADPADLLPRSSDRDGHDAKHGLGRIDAGRACLAAADPICAALVAMGEDAAARAFADARRTKRAVRGAYSKRFARWAVRALLGDRESAQALRAILRHLRLVARDEGRLRAHGDGALLRRVRLLLRGIAARPRPSVTVRTELSTMVQQLAAIEAEPEAVRRFERGLAYLATQLLRASRM